MNIMHKKVSYTEKRARELGIHPDQKKKKKVVKPVKKESFAEETQKDLSKK